MNYMTTDEVAELIGVSTEWLRRLRVKKGGPDYYKIGSSVRYLREDVQAWLDKQRVRAA